MTQQNDLSCLALAAWAVEAVDAADSTAQVHAILERIDAARVYARHAHHPQLESDAHNIRLYAEVRLRELTKKERGTLP